MPRYVDRPLPSDFEVPAIVPRKVKVMPRKPKGAIAEITRDLKEGIIDAAVIVGSDEVFVKVSIVLVQARRICSV
jgi:hypothetical protein